MKEDDIESQDQEKPQKRLFSFFISKEVPAVPADYERGELPIYNSGFFSRVFFTWLLPLMNVGYRRTIQINDLWFLDKRLSIDGISEKFNMYFGRYCARPVDSGVVRIPIIPMIGLLKALFFTFQRPFLKAILFILLSDICDVMVPVLLRNFIRIVQKRIDDDSISMTSGGGYAGGITILLILRTVFINHAFFNSKLVGSQMRSVMTKLILEKALILDSKSKHDYPNGKIFTLMSSDLSKIDMALNYLPMLLTFPIPILIGIALLVINIGISSLAGIGVFVLSILILVVPAAYQMKLRSGSAPYTDQRVGLIREVLNTFKMIKLYSWEDAYEKKILEARTKEISFIFKTQMAINSMLTLVVSLPNITSMVSFLVLYAIKSRSISGPAEIFSSFALFNVLSGIITNLPLWTAYGTAGAISIERIRKFLETPVEVKDLEEKNDLDDDFAVIVKGGAFEWDDFGSNSKSALFHGLHDINLDIKKGEFVVVTGSIGSGKSSLLSAINGTMRKTTGSLQVNSSHIFCGLPWIQSSTIRANIIFGLEFDESRYSAVVKACSLENDFNQFSSGDLTEVGERGITLSGGQKARICLARTVYCNRDTLLLDDVLSAVDSNVGKHIFEHCILGLLKDKTRILVTHQLGLVHTADRIIFLNGNGTIDVGTFEQLSSRNDRFRMLMKSDSHSKDGEENTVVKQNTNSMLDLSVVKGEGYAEEDRAVNGIPLSIYMTYLRSGEGIFGFLLYPLLIIAIILAVFFSIFSSVWLSFWVSNRYPNVHDRQYIGLYILFVFLSLLFLFFEASILGYLITQSSKVLNIKATKKLLHAPMSFIDTSPSGRILNRFTKDTNTLDNEIGEQLKIMIHLSVVSLGILVMCFVYLPWLILTIPGLVILFVTATSYYLASAREVKRLESTTRSLVYNNFNETLSGLDTIKSFDSKDRFLARNDKLLDQLSEVYIVVVATRRWIALTINLAVSCLTLVITLTSLAGEFGISAASAGLVVSSFITLTGMLTSSLIAYSEVENEMNSVERVCQYAKELEQEPSYSIDDQRLNAAWPDKGAISFENVSLRYREGSPLVLKQLNVEVLGSEKVGICGRTGAGKSSLIVALYRLSELSVGKIIIDGVDVGKIGLRDLRSKLSIIPQDPVLFEGSVRKNLDPFDEYDDDKLWDALRRSHLITIDNLQSIKRQHEGEYDKFHLQNEVESDGSNFSLGERQLIALARALVRESKILIMDEATSSVDYETDLLVQNTISKEFKDSTVLCIAHRLKTIIKYDKIMVLDFGEVKEFGAPLALFEENGQFRDMCNASGLKLDDFAIDV